RLHVTAPIAGIVVSAPDAALRPTDGNQLAARSGALISDTNVGSSVDPGDLLCSLAQSGEMEAVAVVDQGDLEFVKSQQTVKMKLEHLPDTLFSGHIERMATEDLRSTPIQLTIKGGGSVATMTDSSGRERPESSMYAARINIDEDGGLLRVGMRGEAKIHTEPRTLWQRLVRSVQRTFHFAM
ncbi:MAG: HlyD family secretion protein, partial [Planctomycetota bacterium]|nr:HlyD family secretion protein [Planctomycetota bacterium]